MKYYPVYDSSSNNLLGLYGVPIGIHDGAESINITIMTKGAVHEGSEEAQKMWDNLINNKLLNYGAAINFEIRKIYPPPKLDSFFPPRYLVIDLSKYDRDVEKYLRWFFKTCTPNQLEIIMNVKPKAANKHSEALVNKLDYTLAEIKEREKHEEIRRLAENIYIENRSFILKEGRPLLEVFKDIWFEAKVFYNYAKEKQEENL